METCLTNELAALQMVRVAFEFNNDVGPYKNILSLFDTGSPVNFFQQSIVPQVLYLNKTPINTGCKGLGGVDLNAVGILKCYIKFSSQNHQVSIFILSDQLLPVPILLGRDFLNLFSIGLTLCNFKLKKKTVIQKSK